jgi:hypothetical protein
MITIVHRSDDQTTDDDAVVAQRVSTDKVTGRREN